MTTDAVLGSRLSHAAAIEPPQRGPARPPAPVPRIAAALLARLLSDALIELEEGIDQRPLADALADAVVAFAPKARPGAELAAWLLDRDEIAEVFGSDFAMDAALRAAVSEAAAAEQGASIATAAAAIAAKRRAAKARR